MTKIQLSIIDAQNSFLDLPESYRPIITSGPLAGTRYIPPMAVSGGHQDCLTIASVIRILCRKLTSIEVFMDTHQVLDMDHYGFWVKADGSALTTPTRITLDDVKSGRYLPRMNDKLDYIIDYLERLPSVGTDAIYVWPEHCVWGTFGHNLHADIQEAVREWSLQTLEYPEYILKGHHPFTENYSGLKAVLPYADVPESQLRSASIEKYRENDITIFVGEASTHCVPDTILDAVKVLLAENFDFSRFVILTDCMSGITGFEGKYTSFIDYMLSIGARVMTSKELVAIL